VCDAKLSVAEGAQTPVAAEIAFESPESDGALTCSLDWRRSEGEEWTIRVRTTEGSEVLLTDGGARLFIDGVEQSVSGIGEYPEIYRRFAELIDERRSDVDVRPLRLVADCLLVGSTQRVEALEL
jgi:hypothetical protein